MSEQLPDLVITEDQKTKVKQAIENYNLAITLDDVICIHQNVKRLSDEMQRLMPVTKVVGDDWYNVILDIVLEKLATEDNSRE